MLPKVIGSPKGIDSNSVKVKSLRDSHAPVISEGIKSPIYSSVSII